MKLSVLRPTDATWTWIFDECLEAGGLNLYCNRKYKGKNDRACIVAYKVVLWRRD